MFDSVDDVVEALAAEGFRATRATATAVYLAANVGNPLFLRGCHGTGKTSLAMAIAHARGAHLVDLRGAVPPWAEIESDSHALLLLDDINPAEEALIALVRDLLAENASGSAAGPPPQPWVILTTSSIAESVEELRGLCRAVTLGYPEFEQEVRIVMERVPRLSRGLAGQVCNVSARLRSAGFTRPPGVGESVSWARTLVALHCSRIDAEMLDHAAARLFSLPEDVRRFRASNPASLVTPGLDYAA